MKILSLLLITLLGFMQCQAQDTLTSKSLEEVISASLADFRQKTAGDKATIYTIIEMNLDKDKIALKENDFIIDSGISAKKIDDKTKKFVLKFLVFITGKQTVVRVIQFRLKKKSRKSIELINLMSGTDYEITSQ